MQLSLMIVKVNNVQNSLRRTGCICDNDEEDKCCHSYEKYGNYSDGLTCGYKVTLQQCVLIEEVTGCT